jgi:transcriptional regulator with XRE-family HTH domain
MKQGVVFPNQPTVGLVARAQRALGMTHRQFGEALGASERTSLRWIAGRSSVTVEHLRTLARLVYPSNPALAASLAEASSETLESLGIVPPSPPPRPALPAHLVGDHLVCAAAEAFGGTPSAARAALHAAFARALEMGLSLEEVANALAASAPVRPPAPP